MNKNIVLAFVASLFFPLVSCKDNNDLPDIPKPEDVTIHFHVRYGDNEDDCPPKTRSLAPGYMFADGKSVNILKCYVYNRNNGTSAAPIKVVDVDITEVDNKRGGDVSISLPQGQHFDVVFLGTSIPHDVSTSKLYYNSSDRSLTVNYSTVACNDEELDCFFASQSDVNTETVLDHTIVLGRPFAQLNIGTQDYTEYNTATPVKDISVSVTGVYNKVNLMDGSLIGSAVNVDFKSSSVPTGQTYPVSGYSYLSMNYLLVNTRKLVDVSLSVNHTDSSVPAYTIYIPNVAVERNYQTNVYGQQLLTGIISD